MTPTNAKSLESWIWDAACSIRGAKDAPKYKDYILPLIFTKRLCDVFDDELNRIAAEVGSRRSAPCWVVPTEITSTGSTTTGGSTDPIATACSAGWGLAGAPTDVLHETCHGVACTRRTVGPSLWATTLEAGPLTGALRACVGQGFTSAVGHKRTPCRSGSPISM